MALHHLACLKRGFYTTYDGLEFSCEGFLFLGFLMVFIFTVDHTLGFTIDLHHFLMEMSYYPNVHTKSSHSC